MARILIAEDDPKQAEVLRRYAMAEGHDVTVAADGRAALDAARSGHPHLVVLDVMMPRLDGFDVCRALRSDPGTVNLPILVLTARTGEENLLDALDLGADDYLTKPYSPRELMARVRTLLRRQRLTGTSAPAPRLSAGDLVVDPATRRVTWAGQTVDCTRGEFTLLELFAAEPGRVFQREQLLRNLRGHDDFVSPRTVDMHVANLRKKLPPTLIRTVYGVGYALTTAE